ncbi:RNA-directed DNA polymerase [Gilvibacter sp.]|uniref:RNA-directed DNA polymerase n=1 Tax=Gilvibacter sp. TaxID=2729997 RepID=UPI003B5234A7
MATINWNEQVKEAYTRLKSYVYYDNFNLILRSRLAQFEGNHDFQDRLNQLASALREYENNPKKIPKRLAAYIKSIEFISLPKTVEPGSSISLKELGILTNVDDGEKSVVIKKNNYLIDSQIEIHLIATLWIQLEGVLLAKKIDKDSYGYHLLTNSDKNQLISKKLTFTPYFEKYQLWRDKGLNVAKSIIEEGNDVTLLSLDIKSFFPSSLIDFKTLKSRILELNGSGLLTDLLKKISAEYNWKIHKKRTRKLPLPIGLISSGVIANWYLTPVDKKIKDSLAPAYYGRYVDDIFIVLSNVKPPNPENSADFKNIEQKYKHKNSYAANYESQKRIKEILYKKFLIDQLFPGKHAVLKASDINPDIISFSPPYQNLEIQTQKLRIFYFNPDWPLALLNKFAKTLKENSSAFWFLPEEEDLKDTFEEKAFDLHYEDSFNKFRSVVDVKSSKYGASVFLAKRIKLRLLAHDSDDESTVKEIKRFFNGPNRIELFGLWEKVFTYFVVSENFDEFEMFYEKCLISIEAITYNNQENAFNTNKTSISLLKKTLFRHLKSSASLAISLNPKIINPKKKSLIDEFKVIKKEYLPHYRKAMLYRHHYLVYTFLSITEYGQSVDTNLLIKDPLFKKLNLHQLKVPFDKKPQDLFWLIPRFIYVQEICLLQFYELILKGKKKESSEPLFSLKDEQPYSIASIFNLAQKLNQKKYEFKDIIDLDPRYAKHNENEKDTIQVQKVNFKKDLLQNSSDEHTLSVGLANIKIFREDIIEAISNESIISRKKRKKILHVLNEAEKIKSEVLILPETCIPLQWLYQMSDEARRKNRAMIFGLEHFTVKQFSFNIGVTILPFEWQGVKDSLIIPRLKNHYSHNESCVIKSYGLKIPKRLPALYHIFKWKGVHFSMYNCFELADIVHRSLFRSKIDVLFAVEYNKDVNYFSNVVESSSRDIHCYVVQSNSRDYGDTRIIQPASTIKMNPARVKGGENDVVLLGILDIKKLRKFQEQRFKCDEANTMFKPTPPDFNHELVTKRLREN